MTYAIYKEDLFYKNCPVYILNAETDCYEMNGSNTFYFEKQDIQGQDEFLFFTKLANAKGAIALCQQTKQPC